MYSRRTYHSYTPEEDNRIFSALSEVKERGLDMRAAVAVLADELNLPPEKIRSRFKTLLVRGVTPVDNSQLNLFDGKPTGVLGEFAGIVGKIEATLQEKNALIEKLTEERNDWKKKYNDLFRMHNKKMHQAKRLATFFMAEDENAETFS